MDGFAGLIMTFSLKIKHLPIYELNMICMAFLLCERGPLSVMCCSRFTTQLVGV